MYAIHTEKRLVDWLHQVSSCSCTIVAAGRCVFFSVTCVENGVPMGAQWGALDDVVMGGVSASNFQVDLKGGEKGQPVGLFQGDDAGRGEQVPV